MVRRIAIPVALMFASMVLLSAVSVSSARQDSVRLRVMQLSFYQQGDEPAISTVDLSIDNEPVFADVEYPFTTDYMSLSGGIHTLTAAISGDVEISAQQALALAAGHRYTVIVGGNYDDEVAFHILDESDKPSDANLVLANLYPDALDIYINDEIAAEKVNPSGGYVFLQAPAGDFNARITPVGEPDTGLVSTTYPTLPGTTLLLVATGEAPDNFFLFVNRSSELTVAACLTALAETPDFDRSARLFQQADLLSDLDDDGVFTVFLPFNRTLDALPDAVIPAEAAQLRVLLANHVIEGNLPPYDLTDHDRLTTRADTEVALAFAETESNLWEIQGVPIWWDIHLSNGVIYAVDGVIIPWSRITYR